jgi:DNA primase
MSSSTELIKDRLGIADVVGSYIKIEKSGANYKAKCPFHHEKTPSFYISPGRNSYYCFGCGAKGDIFTFVQEFEKVDFIGALKLLAEKAGVELSQFKQNDAEKNEHERLREVLEKSTQAYQDSLLKSGTKEAKEAIEYLKGRGLTDKTIEEWRIGWAPNEWRAVSDVLKRQGVSEADMELVGLVKRAEKGDGIYDRFRSRVIFPLFDASNRVIGYSGRLFGVPDTDGPKYLNSPDTPLFNKSEILYGFNKAKDGIRQWKYAILVEGQMDLLMCHQNGFANTVATSGTSLTRQHLEKIRKISDNIKIVYDADSAGLKATLRAWTAALSLDMDVKIAQLPAGDDPASILLSNKETFKDALKHSKHIIEYQLDVLIGQHLEKRKLWQAVESELLPYVAALTSAIDRAHFIGLISLKVGITEDDLREQLNKTKSIAPDQFSNDQQVTSGLTSSQSTPISNGVSTSRRLQVSSVIDRLAGIALWKGDTKKEELRKRLNEILLEPSDVAYAESLFESDRTDLAFEAELIYTEDSKLEHGVQELLNELEERVLKERLSDLMHRLATAEKKIEKEEVMKLTAECQDISTRLSQLQNKRKK